MNNHHLALRKSINDIIEESHQTNSITTVILNENENTELKNAANIYFTSEFAAGNWNGYNWCVNITIVT